MSQCTLCLKETTSTPVAFTCMRCSAPLVACESCCAERAKFYGVGFEKYVQMLMEVRHHAQWHPTLPEARQ